MSYYQTSNMFFIRLFLASTWKKLEVTVFVSSQTAVKDGHGFEIAVRAWLHKTPVTTMGIRTCTCKCTNNGFVSDLLKRALKCRFFQPGPGWIICAAETGARYKIAKD